MLRPRKLPVLLPALAAVLALVSVPAAGSVSVAAAPGVSVHRIFGADRYATSAAVARATFGTSPTPINRAVVASGTDFPDAAIGANLLSGYYGSGPVLLTRRHDVPAPIVDVLTQLRIAQPWILGGTAVVDLAVQHRLDTLVARFGTAGEVNRYAGSDRYATGASVLRTAFDHEANVIAELDGKRTAFLVSGVAASDALAAAPLTYALYGSPVQGKFPLLLTQPDVLSTASRDALLSISSGDGRRIEQVIVIGGEGAISPAVVSQVGALGISTRRIAGADRQATAVAVADFAIQTLGWSPAHINLARGNEFADAASTGPHAGQERAPLLFTVSPNQLGSGTAEFLRAHAGVTQSIDVIGGRAAVSDAVVAQAQTAAKG